MLFLIDVKTGNALAKVPIAVVSCQVASAVNCPKEVSCVKDEWSNWCTPLRRSRMTSDQCHPQELHRDDDCFHPDSL